MLLKVGLAWSAELHGDEFESLGLESGDDGSDESSLDAVRLDHDESSFSLCAFHSKI